MAVEDLKEASHATHLLLNVFLQVILLLHYPRCHVLISRKIRTSLFFLLLSKIFCVSKQLRNSQRDSSRLYICESERERESMGFLTVTPAFLVFLKVGLEDEDKVGINGKVDACFCSFSEKCQNKSWVGQFGDLAIGFTSHCRAGQKKKC